MRARASFLIALLCGFMPVFDWFSVDEDGLPSTDDDSYYGTSYSVPVIGCNEITKQTFDMTLVYNFDDNGWCYAGLPDGPNPEDYEVPAITHYGYLPRCDF